MRAFSEVYRQFQQEEDEWVRSEGKRLSASEPQLSGCKRSSPIVRLTVAVLLPLAADLTPKIGPDFMSVL